MNVFNRHKKMHKTLLQKYEKDCYKKMKPEISIYQCQMGELLLQIKLGKLCFTENVHTCKKLSSLVKKAKKLAKEYDLVYTGVRRSMLDTLSGILKRKYIGKIRDNLFATPSIYTMLKRKKR